MWIYGGVIIYGRGGLVQIPKIVCTQNVPPLGMREPRFCPPPRIPRTETEIPYVIQLEPLQDVYE